MGRRDGSHAPVYYYRTDNPCDRILGVLGPPHEIVQHRQALPYREVMKAIATVRASPSTGVGELASEFLVLNAAR